MAPAGAGYLTAVALAMALASPAHSAHPVAVLYATEAQKDSVAAYNIYEGGRLANLPFQQVSVDDNPRRLLATQNALYVATKERIEALKIDTETGWLSWFRSPDAAKTSSDDLEKASKDKCHDLKKPSKDGEAVIQRPDRVEKAGFQYLAVDHPTGRYLYAAATNQDRIIGYPISSEPGKEGSIRDIGSCVQGRSATRYRGLAATEKKLYAAASGLGRIHVFPLSEGRIQAFPTRATCDGGLDRRKSCTDDAQCRVSKCRFKKAGETGSCKKGNNQEGDCTEHKDCGDEEKECKHTPVCRLGPNKGKSCEDDSECGEDPDACDGRCPCIEDKSVCEDGPDKGKSCTDDSECKEDPGCSDGICRCVPERQLEVFVDGCDEHRSGIPIGFPETSSGSLGRPKALLLDHDTRTLYITEVIGNCIIGCPIDQEDGSLPDCPNRKFRQGISRTNSGAEYEQITLSADRVLFASVFVNGELRAFDLKSGGLLPRKPKKRHPSSIFSTPVGVATCGDGLYVAQGDLNRIDHFRIDEEGFSSVLPSSHTAEIEGSFPNDVAVVPLDGAGCTP